MIHRRTTAQRLLTILALACVTPLFAACRDALPAVAESAVLPPELLGRWTFDGTSGGIEGRELAAADGSWIAITERNTIERHAADGRLESTEAFEPSRGRSIFGSDDWILRGEDQTERVIRLHPGDVLTLSDNAYDGFSSRYTRAR